MIRDLFHRLILGRGSGQEFTVHTNIFAYKGWHLVSPAFIQTPLLIIFLENQNLHI